MTDLKTQRKIAADIFVQTFPDKKLMNLDPLLAMQAQMKAAEKKGGSRSKKQTGGSESETGVVEILYELSRQIPASIDAELERLVFDRERLILSGSTPNFNTVDQIKGHIEKSDIFKSVEIGSAASRKYGKRVEFKFIVEM